MIIALTLLTLFFLLASGFYSGTEMGLYCVNPIRLRLQAAQRPTRSIRWLTTLVQSREQSVLAILLGTNVANYLLTVFGSEWLVHVAGVNPAHVEFYAAAILAPLVFVLGDVVPKNWFQLEANKLMYRSAGVLQVTVTLFRYTGLVSLLGMMTRIGARFAGDDPQADAWQGARGEVMGLLREGAAAGAMTPEQGEFMENVMMLSTIRVGQIMIPREQVTTLPLGATRRQFRQVIENSRHSRLPVLDANQSEVLGVVYVKDTLAEALDGNATDAMHPPLIISANETASKALIRMQQSKEAMAIVTGPNRQYVGIITIKDVVEEIFGELPEW